MAKKHRKAPKVALFTATEDNLAAAKSICSALASAAGSRPLEEDEVFYAMSMIGGLIEAAEAGVDELQRELIAARASGAEQSNVIRIAH